MEQRFLPMNSVKKFSVTLAALSAFAVVSIQAATPAELEAVGQKVASAKAVEAPAVVTREIAKASKEDKTAFATAALSAGLRKHPGSIASLLTSAIKASPESTEALVDTALNIQPDSSMVVLRAVAEAHPAKSDLALAAVVKRTPAKRAAFERELTTVRTAAAARRVAVAPGAAAPVPAGAALKAPVVIVTPKPSTPPPVQVSTYGGADPSRP